MKPHITTFPKLSKNKVSRQWASIQIFKATGAAKTFLGS